MHLEHMVSSCMIRKAYPSDVSDDEWAFAAPYLTLMAEEAPQRVHDLREVFNGLRWMIRTGVSWRMLPHDLPRWKVVYQQTQRWLKADVYAEMAHDLRLAPFRQAQPSAAILDRRTLPSTPESGERAGYDGAKRSPTPHRKAVPTRRRRVAQGKRGSKVHVAVDTLGHRLALHVTAADQQDRAQVEPLAHDLQTVTPRGGRADRWRSRFHG